MNNQPFDEDGGGTISFLKIGKENSYLSNTNELAGKIPLPTIDMRSIIVAWVNWILNNNLQSYLT